MVHDSTLGVAVDTAHNSILDVAPNMVRAKTLGCICISTSTSTTGDFPIGGSHALNGCSYGDRFASVLWDLRLIRLTIKTRGVSACTVRDSMYGCRHVHGSRLDYGCRSDNGSRCMFGGHAINGSRRFYGSRPALVHVCTSGVSQTLVHVFAMYESKGVVHIGSSGVEGGEVRILVLEEVVSMAHVCASGVEGGKVHIGGMGYTRFYGSHPCSGMRLSKVSIAFTGGVPQLARVHFMDVADSWAHLGASVVAS